MSPRILNVGKCKYLCHSEVTPYLVVPHLEQLTFLTLSDSSCSTLSAFTPEVDASAHAATESSIINPLQKLMVMVMPRP